MPDIEFACITVGEVDFNVASTGTGAPVVLLHGWPHTWQVWHPVMDRLAEHHRVIAPDLRGAGGSSRATTGYDLHTLADDVAVLLDRLNVTDALMAGIDVGTPIAWMLGGRHPRLVRRLAVMEAVLGDLPGAQSFLAGGAPWWFGFHAIDGLAESVLEGHEDRYIGWFLDAGTATALDPGLRREFIDAYTGRESLRCGLRALSPGGLGCRADPCAARRPGPP